MFRAVRPEPARNDERGAAFALLFADLDENERRQRIDSALHLVETGDLDPAGIFVLRDQGNLEGVVVCLPVPGASGLIWPPHVLTGRRQRHKEDTLVLAAVNWLRQRGAKLAQCLLSQEEVPLATPLERNGFRHITHLWYLKNDLGLVTARDQAGARLTYQAYQPDDPAVFHQTLLRTYENSLDCPEVNGVRTIGEIIAGHQAQGKVPAGGWRLALRDGQPVGVLILIELPESGNWEIAYLGVVPELRRFGHAREVVNLAIDQARTGGARALTLSVDGRNQPAWNLYRQLNFEPTDRREVFLASW